MEVLYKAAAVAFSVLTWSLSVAWPIPASAAPLEACGTILQVPDEVAGHVKALCGFNLPEDMDVTPDGRHILVGDLGMSVTPNGIKMATTPHEILVIDTATDRVAPLERVRDKDQNWGDPTCRPRDPVGPFFVLGMNISQRSPGIVQLSLINSIGGSHIEFYQLDETRGRLQAAWRGCVETPGEGAVDAVAPLPGGGFVASIIYETRVGLSAAAAAAARGQPTGWLIAWTPDKGLRRLPYSEGRLNNGIQVSHEGSQVYMAETGARRIATYSLIEEKFVKGSGLPFYPDNVRRGPGGTVIVGGTASTSLCLGRTAQGCTNESWVARWHPDTGVSEILFHVPPGLLSGTTGGVISKGSLFVSSLSDPLILKVRLREQR